MIPLTATPDDMDFDALAALGRGRLAALAPGWTDYNVHDPGITLVELLAWAADTQIYAAGRNRRDERLAMAALLGVRPRGAVAAAGTLYLADPAAATEGYTIAAGTRLAPTGGSAPRLEVAQAVSLLPLELVRLSAEEKGGVRDLTDRNSRARVSFDPFGAPATAGSALVVRLRGALADGEALLSIGAEVEGGGSDTPERDQLGRIAIFYRRDAGDEVPLERVADTSADLQRSGAIVVRLPKGGPQAGRAVHDIVLRLVRGNALMPRLLAVGPNALPVVQQARFDGLSFAGAGRAYQALAIAHAALLDPDELAEGLPWRLTEASPAVRVDGAPWQQGELDRAGPDDTCFAASEESDRGSVTILFGNGVNGRRPAAYAPIAADVALTCGAAGNVAAPLDWQMAAPRIAWRNRQPIAGGADPLTPDDLLEVARARLHRDRAFAASADIEAAARDLPEAFGVARAWVLEGWEPGRRRPANPSTRTLLVARKGEGMETPGWLRAVSRRLAPRLPLGERLVVAAPASRRLRIAARVGVAKGSAPQDVRQQVADEIIRRIGETAEWPLGRAVSATAIAGWIRRVPGVAMVSAVALLDLDGKVLGETLPLRPNELPCLAAEHLAADLLVAAGATS